MEVCIYLSELYLTFTLLFRTFPNNIDTGSLPNIDPSSAEDILYINNVIDIKNYNNHFIRFNLKTKCFNGSAQYVGNFTNGKMTLESILEKYLKNKELCLEI